VNHAKARESYISIIERQSSVNGRYENINRISPSAGDGNFSLVFKADDKVGKKKVALKFYNPLERDEYRERCFDRESRILEKLRGQRDILQLVEPRSELTIELVDQATSIPLIIKLPFLVTDLAMSNVKHYIYDEATQSIKSLLYFRSMCRAVQRIHAAQICHRDLKPDNFFMVEHGNVCLGDFGSARPLDGAEPAILTKYYFWRGDRRYTAPEMFAAMDENVNLFYYADMFSLGAILFEMFTKNNLLTLVFDAGYQLELLQTFQLIPETRRHQMFSELVGEIAKRRRLPDIDDFNNPIPKSIQTRLNSLYKGLAHLDYRHRIDSFQVVFTEVDRCINVLRNEDWYQRLAELRRKWQERHKQRKEGMNNS